MSNKTTNIAGVLELPDSTEETPVWIDGSFKAVVTQTRPPEGRKPGKGVLVDPDDASLSIECSFFGKNPCPYDGKVVNFSGAGMKRTDYKGKAQMTAGEKTNLTTFGDAVEPEAGKHMPHSPSPYKAPAPENFNDGMGKIQLMYLHATRHAINIREILITLHDHKMTDDQFQSCVSCIFIEANRKGLSVNPPVLG